MSESEPTPVQPTPVNDATAAVARQVQLRVAAAQTARSSQRTAVRRVGVAKPEGAKPKHTVVRPGRATTVKSGKGTKRTTPAEPKPQPVSVPKAEAAKLAADTAKLQSDRLAKARQVLAKGDEAQWEIAALTFEATEADGAAKMSKQDWAEALGVSPSAVSRWCSVHAAFGLKGARQTITHGKRKGEELSFNDHLEMLKTDDALKAKLLKAMQASGQSFATELKKHREAEKNGESKTAKDKTAATTASLVNRVVAGEEDRTEAFSQLAQLCVKHMIAFGEAFEGMEGTTLSETEKQIVRSVLNQATEIDRIFDERLAKTLNA